MSRLSVLKDIPRDAKILVSTNALRSFSVAVINVSFSIYLSKLGASPIDIGLTFTGISLFSAFRSLLEGLIADKIGRKPILLFTAASMATGGTIFFLTNNLPILTIAAVLFSVGGTVGYTPAEQAMLSEKVRSEERTKAFSLNAFLGTIAAIFGSVAGGLPEALQAFGLPEIDSYRQIFIILAVAGAITFCLFTILEETIDRDDQNEITIEGDEAGRDERIFLMKWSGVVALDMIGGSFGNLISYWYYLRFGVGPAQIGTLSAVSQFLSSFSYILGFKMAKSFGTITATTLSRLPVVAVNLLTPLMPSFLAVSVIRVFMSLFSMIDVPLRQSYLMGVIKTRKRASAVGVVSVVSRVTAAGAPSLTGYFIQYVSLALPFFCGASFQLASASLMYFLFKDIKPPEEE